MIRDEIASKIHATLHTLQSSGKLPTADYGPPEIVDTRSPEHGDFACNIAMTSSKKSGMAPREMANMMASELAKDDDFEAVEVAGPGFINIRLKPVFLSGYVKTVLALGDALALSKNANPKKINIEFVSVNPNGPITVGSGRGAAFGDTLCRVIQASGDLVHREYYINDGVNSEQMARFADSVKHILLNLEVPDNGYKGEYVHQVAKEARSLVRERIFEKRREAIERAMGGAKEQEEREFHARRLKELVSELEELAGESAVATELAEEFGKEIAELPLEDFQLISQDLMIKRQREDLEIFGVRFDTWFSEQRLHDDGSVQAALEELLEKDVADRQPYSITIEQAGRHEEPTRVKTAEQPGAVWLRSTRFDDDKDRVLVREDGRPTYIASDIAYHKNKFERGFDKLIDIWGPDHHGYIGRMNAAIQALGYPLDRFEVIIFQIVRFVKDGQPAPMRKRDGNIYELRDLVYEIGKNSAPHLPIEEQIRIGVDVSRFFYLMRSHDTHMDFDIDLATKQSDENPVFYTQYAHARICSVLKRAEDAGISAGSDYSVLAKLVHPREMALIKKILDLPYEVKRAATDYGVHRLTTYAVELARSFHHFYDACRVVQPDDIPLSQARLLLCKAALQGLRSTFDLLGISAPERMDRVEPVEPISAE